MEIQKDLKKFLLFALRWIPTYTLGTKAASPLVKVNQRSNTLVGTIILSTTVDISRHEVERLSTKSSTQQGW